MQIGWEESGYLLLSHEDTHFQKLTGQTGVSEMYARTFTAIVLRGTYLKSHPLKNRLVEMDLHIWGGAAFMHP